MAILVDSSYYVDVQRSGRDVRQLLLPWLSRGELYTCGIVRAEVLRGIVKPNIKAGMNAFFDLIGIFRPTNPFGWKLPSLRGSWTDPGWFSRLRTWQLGAVPFG